jgi:hypothetical protein
LTKSIKLFNNQTIASSGVTKKLEEIGEEAVDSSSVEAADIESVTVAAHAQLLHMSNQKLLRSNC